MWSILEDVQLYGIQNYNQKSLSTTEAEYIDLSQSLREITPLMTLIEELAAVLAIIIEKAQIHYTVFKDNKGCAELVECPIMRPRTKHVGLKYIILDLK